jgi:hemerythrin-like domain-containing protein
MSGDIKTIIDDEEMFLEHMISRIKKGEDPSLVFLEAFKRHMEIAASHIDCPYCAKHMRIEAEEVEKVIQWIKSRGNKTHSHSITERLSIIPSSMKILVYTILGGLKRAGII